MQKKTSERSAYTVAFGDLTISVRGSDNGDPMDHDELETKGVHWFNERDQSTLRDIRKAEKKEIRKAAIRTDENFFDKIHENTAHRVPKPKPRSQYAMKPLNPVTLVGNDNFVMTESVRSVVQDSAQEEEAVKSKQCWSSDPEFGVPKPTHVADFFVGSVNQVNQISCWNCGTFMDVMQWRTLPKFLPIRYNEKTKFFMITGYFCCWECVRAHALVTRSDILPMLSYMLLKLYGKYIKIVNHCKRTDLQHFGGSVSMEQFKKNLHECNHVRITHRLEWHPEILNCVRVKKEFE